MLVGLAAASVGTAGEPADDDWGEYDPAALVKAQRVNGVLLEIKAAHEAHAGGDRIRIDWSFDYDGPRRPLVILKPSLTRLTGGQTRLLVVATGKSGKSYGYALFSPLQALEDNGVGSKTDWFLRVAEGRRGESLEVPLADVKRLFLKKLPAEYDAAKPPPLYLQLFHEPEDRGRHLQLDAWTGKLASRAVRVELKSW